FLQIPRALKATLSPYTTLFRSVHPDLNFTFPVPGSGKDDEKEDDKAVDILTSWRRFVLDRGYGNLQDWVAHNAFTKQLNISKAADRKSTRLNSSHVKISYAVFC